MLSEKQSEGAELKKPVKIKRALFSVSDKRGIAELAISLSKTGTEIVATGKTADVLTKAGIKVVPIEDISGSPEVFQGRMKTLSFNVCSGILYRRDDTNDEKDRERLRVPAIDCVVVNFYPFEKARESGASEPELIEQIDIGGPTLVRAAAKNYQDVLVLTAPEQYESVIDEISQSGTVSLNVRKKCAREAWQKIFKYDQAIAETMNGVYRQKLRYGENPHQKAYIEYEKDSPIAWNERLGPNELSFNNILDLSSAFEMVVEFERMAHNQARTFSTVVIVKHNNPCGVAMVPQEVSSSQKLALIKAWEGDSVSSFGGVVVFNKAIEDETATWLSDHFIECIAAPNLSPNDAILKKLFTKRKNLKAINIKRFDDLPMETTVTVPGGRIVQTLDSSSNRVADEVLRTVTETPWPGDKSILAKFGIIVCKGLKSNSIAIVREVRGISGSMQLVGAGQGQPNRVEALEKLAIPRANNTLKADSGRLEECVLISDAFFPFRDTVDVAHATGIRYIVQPGGSIRDKDSISACNEHKIAMVFTGVRHFRH